MPVFRRDKRGTRLREGHAQTKRSDHDPIRSDHHLSLGQPAQELNAGNAPGNRGIERNQARVFFPNYQQVSRKAGWFMEQTIDWGSAGIAMSTLTRLSFDSRPATGANEKTYHVAREVTAAVSSPALRSSSPWPWVIALAISSMMWVGIGWLIWTLV
jgi:hypothetical protein